MVLSSLVRWSIIKTSTGFVTFVGQKGYLSDWQNNLEIKHRQILLEREKREKRERTRKRENAKARLCSRHFTKMLREENERIRILKFEMNRRTSINDCRIVK